MAIYFPNIWWSLGGPTQSKIWIVVNEIRIQELEKRVKKLEKK